MAIKPIPPAIAATPTTIQTRFADAFRTARRCPLSICRSSRSTACRTRGLSINAPTAQTASGGKIVRIDPHPKHPDYDLGDRTLMPGGVDTHVHIGWHFGADDKSHPDNSDKSESPEAYTLYAAENAYRTLQGGITTVQSLGSQ